MHTKEELKLDFLDHVAIRVKDIERSSLWYQKVLNLREYKMKEWGEFPIFLLSGKSGIALFPADPNDTKLDQKSRNIKIDHFAFNVSKRHFELAKNYFRELKLDFRFQDHHYFHSIYTKDPDGHTVELTTLVVDEIDFYGHFE